VTGTERIVDFGREQPDFVDAAAMMFFAGPLISVDSGLGNLAGGKIGVPVWIMLPFILRALVA